MITFYAKNRAEWRRWLAKNAAKSDEIWLVYYKKHSGKPRVPYDDAVEEALCFGWIDGKVKKIDADCFAQRFTPRKPTSVWAPSNIKRMEKLMADGRVTPAGVAVYKPERKSEPLPSKMSANLEKRFKAQTEAWKNFEKFPPYYRRMTTGWVASGKREETQLKRLEKLIEFSGRNERIKLM